ncbi:MAG: autotransporter outer membrane beta-barrel domain-containing protein [Oceanospirillaceae bacterium]|nr:autotransporter outer membrane beta-barrel domain-containing protein [Oceanospirillaceae bacterium]
MALSIWTCSHRISYNPFILILVVFLLLWPALKAQASTSISLSSTSLEFGEVETNGYRDIRVTLSILPSTVTQVVATDYNSVFSISGTDCQSGLSDSQRTCYVDVRFTPTTTGSVSHTIVLNYAAIDEADTVTLTGTGIVPGSVTAGPLAPFTQEKDNNYSTSAVIITTCTSGNASAALQRDCNQLVQAANSGDAQTTAALNQISPETATKSSQVTHQSATTQARNITSRMVELRSGASGISVQGVGLNIDGKYLPAGQIVQSSLQPLGMGASADETFANSKIGVFFSGEIAKGSRDESALESDLDYKTYGITAGVDYRLNDKFFLGAALGFIDTKAELSNSNAELDTRGYSLSFYGSYYLEDNYFTDFSLTFGKNNFDQNRNLNFVLGGSTVNQKFNAQYSGTYTSILLGAGKDIQKGPWSFGPRAKLEYTRSRTDTATETASDATGPGSGWVTQIGSNTQDSLLFQLGARVSYAHSANWGVIFPYAQLDLAHEFQQDAQVINAHFVQDPASTQIKIKSDKPDRNFLKLNLGTSAQFKNGTSGFANYSTVLSNSVWDSHTLSVGVRLEF